LERFIDCATEIVNAIHDIINMTAAIYHDKNKRLGFLYVKEFNGR